MQLAIETSLDIRAVKTFADAGVVATKILSMCRGFKEIDSMEKTTKEILLTMLIYGASRCNQEPLLFIKRALEEDVDQLDTHLMGEARKQYEILKAHSSKQYRRQIQCLLYSQLRSLFRQSKLKAPDALPRGPAVPLPQETRSGIST
jgi:hypothetical protein